MVRFQGAIDGWGSYTVQNGGTRFFFAGDEVRYAAAHLTQVSYWGAHCPVFKGDRSGRHYIVDTAFTLVLSGLKTLRQSIPVAAALRAAHPAFRKERF